MYASLSKRGVALVVDALIVWFLRQTIDLLAALALGTNYGAVLPVILVAYFAGFPLTKWQATPGKRLMGMKITSLGGEKIGAIRSLLRFAISLISFVVFGLGYVQGTVSARRQTLHDLVAGTVVVNVELSPAQIVANQPVRPTWKSQFKNVAVLLLVSAACVYVYLYPMHGKQAMEINEHNMAEMSPVIAALDTYKLRRGRYPESLAELQPDFLMKAPQLVRIKTLNYAVSPAGDQCWLAIHWHEAGIFLPSDRANEYECAARSWTNLDYNDLHVK